MELREKPGIMQRLAEAAIRFRLVLLAILIPLWAVFSLSWTDFISQLLAGAEVNGQMLYGLMAGDFAWRSVLLGPVFAVLLLFLVRGNFFGWRHGLKWLACVAALMALMFLLDGSEPVLAFIVMAVLVVAVTLFFFVKSLLAIALLPLLLLAYGLSTLLLAIGVSPMGWQGLMALYLADSLILLVSIGKDLREGRAVSGAVAGALRTHLPMLLASVACFAVTDIFFLVLGVPVLGAGSLPRALGCYGAYALWMVAVYVPLLSFCPLGRIRANKRTFSATK